MSFNLVRQTRKISLKPVFLYVPCIGPVVISILLINKRVLLEQNIS